MKSGIVIALPQYFACFPPSFFVLNPPSYLFSVPKIPNTATMIDQTLAYATSHPLSFPFYLITVALLSYLLLSELSRQRARLPGFLGPSGLPLIGNLHQIRVNAAEQYRLWSQTHGPVYQIMLGNIPVIVVNSAASARAIFGQNSQALSSRPEFYTFHKVVSSTAGTTIGTSPFSESLKRRRKGAASALNKPSVASYVPHIDLETRVYLREFLEYGDAGKKAIDPMPMIQRLSLSLALTLNWGTRLASQDSELFKEITHVEEEVSKFRSTTGNLQDYIPLLRWNPFSFGSKKARDMRRRRDVYLRALNEELDRKMRDGTDEPCIQGNVLRDPEAKLSAEELTSISLTMLSGGLDTLTTLVAWSVALMADRPEIQEKAVQEIGKFYEISNPLCDAEDDQKCAYVVALVREMLRYYTVLRLSLPRASVRDVTWEGKTIPAGSVIFLNAWACNMDPDVWSDPEVFRPERWLEQPDAPMFTYGLGYRMCAGSLLANREMYLIWMRTLNAFRIVKVDDVDVHPVSGIEDQTQLVAVPRRYRVRVVPRDEGALRRALGEGEKEKV
jgi:3-hydroxyphenylacetate 6-hydroxylase